AVLETAGSPRLKDVIAAFAAIDPAQEDKDGRADSARAQLRALAADPEALADIDAALAAFSASQPHGRSAMHQLLERQHYRLAYWR
ncbi:hypothetical protein ACPXA0_26040, partial [Escherichia coli]